MTKQAPGWKPTKEECALIRSVAKRDTYSLRRIEIGIRCNTQHEDMPRSMNIARVAKNAADNVFDTDLYDFASWADFRKGVKLTDTGTAIVDFYLYSAHGLESNIVLHYADGRITQILSVRGHNLLSQSA